MGTGYGFAVCCGILLSLFTALPAHAAVEASPRVQEQRRLFLGAPHALQTHDAAAYRKIAAALIDYPLYPYLVYGELRSRLWKASPDEVDAFLTRYGDLPMADDLRRDWLRALAKRGDWGAFLKFYTPQSDTTLQCLQLQARISVRSDAYLLEDTRTLWLSARSQPPDCNAAFERLYRSPLMTNELVWSRIRLAMADGETGIAATLAKRLPAADQHWVERWIATYQNPVKWTQDPAFEDTPIARAIVLQGVRRLAQADTDLAIRRWPELRSRYGFTPAEQAETDRVIALRAAQNRHPKAMELLGAVPVAGVNEEVFDWRLRVALQNRDWRTLLKWTDGETPKEDPVRQSWLYWRARALAETGDAADADAIYRELSGERDYYAFLSADRLGIPYELKHHPLPEDAGEWQRLLQLPAVQRARELFVLGMSYGAGREWQHALDGMTTYQMQIAAMIASDWGWYHRAILTMAKAQSMDDLVLRFPVPYEEELRQYADKRDLDLAWVYALVRAESAFLEDARSPAGALGLMQVMPRTARETAKSLGLRRFSISQLLDPDTNIPIGTAYLKQMVDRFDGNVVLATAAYNAGPGNVSTWIPDRDCVEPDVWIERIPITETRKYVQRILYYASIYDWRLGLDPVPLRERMVAVQPRARALLADLGCSGAAVSQN